AWRRTAERQLSGQEREAIVALAFDLPAVWHAFTTTPADRQRMARMLVERVTVVVDKESERVDVVVQWLGGVERQHTLERAVSRYKQQSDYPRLVERLTELCQKRLSSSVIA